MRQLITTASCDKVISLKLIDTQLIAYTINSDDDDDDDDNWFLVFCCTPLVASIFNCWWALLFSAYLPWLVLRFVLENYSPLLCYINCADDYNKTELNWTVMHSRRVAEILMHVKTSPSVSIWSSGSLRFQWLVPLNILNININDLYTYCTVLKFFMRVGPAWSRLWLDQISNFLTMLPVRNLTLFFWLLLSIHYWCCLIFIVTIRFYGIAVSWCHWGIILSSSSY
jgi:hypothetical protein